MSFDIEISSPLQSSDVEGFYGGPGAGGHQSEHWYIHYGMDLGARADAEVRAAFDCHITKLNVGNVNVTGGKVFGAEVFARSTNDRVGAFYTHIHDLDSAVVAGAILARGQLIGHVVPATSTSPHVHLALVEIIGTDYKGIDIYEDMKRATQSGDTLRVAFNQDGTPPSVGSSAGTQTVGPQATDPERAQPDEDLGNTRGVQQALAVLGYDPGIVDGRDGPKTRAAVAAFQRDAGLDPDGVVGPETRALVEQALRDQRAGQPQ